MMNDVKSRTPIACPPCESAPTGPTSQDTQKGVPAPDNRRAGKTSFMLSAAARLALDELMPMWNFPSKGEAVTQALLYLQHQSRSNAVSRLPVIKEYSDREG